jgi:hypothetical protein
METPGNLSEVVQFLIDIINPLIVLLVGLSLLSFFWGLTVFIHKSGDTKSHEAGKNLMKWGLVAFFIMFSIYGILRFFYNDFFSDPFGLPVLPD